MARGVIAAQRAASVFDDPAAKDAFERGFKGAPERGSEGTA